MGASVSAILNGKAQIVSKDPNQEGYPNVWMATNGVEAVPVVRSRIPFFSDTHGNE